jgi:hypothetical protein
VNEEVIVQERVMKKITKEQNGCVRGGMQNANIHKYDGINFGFT